MNDENILLEVRPSWLNFVIHFLFFWLLIPLIIALWKRASLVLRVTSSKVLLEEGVLNKNNKELYISDLRSIDTKQNILQRIFGIGDIMIATSGTENYECEAKGVPDPKGIKNLINQYR